jgi:hypothetical protein
MGIGRNVRPIHRDFNAEYNGIPVWSSSQTAAVIGMHKSVSNDSRQLFFLERFYKSYPHVGVSLLL